MTYRELIKELQTLSDEQLDSDLTVHLINDDEYLPATFGIAADSEGVLDDNHPVFAIGW